MVDLPRQTNYELAVSRAVEQLRHVPAEDLKCLGAERLEDGRLRLPVLNAFFLVDSAAGKVESPEGEAVGVGWAILALHYLASPVKGAVPAATVSFGQIADGRGYMGPYNGRVIQRFLRTAGRTEHDFRCSAGRLGGEEVKGGDAAFLFRVFPLFPVTVVWHAGDEELGPGATMLYAKDAAARMCVEDIVVMSELLVGKLSGKGW